MGVGALSGLVGVAITAFIDAPPGATIVLVGLAGFSLTAPLGIVVQRRRKALMPFPDEGEHGLDPIQPPELAHATSDQHGHVHGPGWRPCRSRARRPCRLFARWPASCGPRRSL
ncbi:MAG: hypothetical protein R2709_08195 [Marmoricola sp.]